MTQRRIDMNGVSHKVVADEIWLFDENTVIQVVQSGSRGG